MKFPAWYGMGVGILIILQWIFFLATRSIPKSQTELREIGHHMAAELLLAVTLLVGGITALRSMQPGAKILLVAPGMATYREINSPGYFAQLGQWSLVGMFAVLLLARHGV